MDKKTVLSKGAEPVAWLCEATHEDDISGEESLVVCLTEKQAKEYVTESAYVVTPLYTHAQPQADTAELERQLAECQQERKEQARLNGMGGEREARLLAQLAEENSARIKGDDANTLLRRQLFKAETERGVMVEEFDKAQARIAQLEESLQNYTVGGSSYSKFAREALSEPAPDWLATHDNEVLERAAVEAEKHDYSPYCAEAIRALKTEVEK